MAIKKKNAKNEEIVRNGLILDTEGAIFLASFVLKIAEHYKKETQDAATADVVDFKWWNIALNRALSSIAWQNMQEFCRIVEYVDLIFEMINKAKESGFEPTKEVKDSKLKQFTLIYLHELAVKRKVKPKPIDPCYVNELLMDLPSKEEIESIHSWRVDQCELHPSFFKGQKQITDSFALVKK